LISPGRKTHDQIVYVSIHRRWHSTILNVWSFKGADCDTDQYLVVAEVRERLSLSEWKTWKFDMEKFSLNLFCTCS
jgi:hypothetical protein